MKYSSNVTTFLHFPQRPLQESRLKGANSQKTPHLKTKQIRLLLSAGSSVGTDTWERCSTPNSNQMFFGVLVLRGSPLEYSALPLLLPVGRGAQDGPDGFIKHRLQAALRQSRALQVLHRACGSNKAFRGSKICRQTQKNKISDA